MRLHYVFIWIVLLTNPARCTDSRTTCYTKPPTILEGGIATLVCSFPEPVTKIRSDILVQRNKFNTASASAPSVLDCPLSVRQDPGGCVEGDGYHFKGFSSNAKEVEIFIQNVSKKHEGSYTCQLVGHNSIIIPCNFTLDRIPPEDRRTEIETTQSSVSITSKANGIQVSLGEENGSQSSVGTIAGVAVGCIALLLIVAICAIVVYRKCFLRKRAEDGLKDLLKEKSGNPSSSDQAETGDSGSPENISTETHDEKTSSRKRDKSASDTKNNAVGSNGEKQALQLGKETELPGQAAQDIEQSSSAESEISSNYCGKKQSGASQNESAPAPEHDILLSSWMLKGITKKPDELTSITGQRTPIQNTIPHVPKARVELHVLGYTSTERDVEGTVLCQESDTSKQSENVNAQESSQQRNAAESSKETVIPKPIMVHESKFNEMKETMGPQEDTESIPPGLDQAVYNVGEIAVNTLKTKESFERKEKEGVSMQLQGKPGSAPQAVDQTVEDAADIKEGKGKGTWPQTAFKFWESKVSDGTKEPLVNSENTKRKTKLPKSDQDIGDDAAMSPLITQTEDAEEQFLKQ